jgi:hypothetical protein
MKMGNSAKLAKGVEVPGTWYLCDFCGTAKIEQAMPHYKKLVGAKCYLSPCNLKDAEKWTEWDNDLKVTIC